MATTKTTIKQTTSRYGTPRAYVEVVLPPEATWRSGMATLYHVAAGVELRTPAHEGWSTCVVPSNDHQRPGGRVEIELGDGTEAEAERALAVLEQVVAMLFGEKDPHTVRRS